MSLPKPHFPADIPGFDFCYPFGAMPRQTKSKRQLAESKRNPVYFHLSPPILEAIEKLCSAEHRTRANLLERLVEEALRARGVKL